MESALRHCGAVLLSAFSAAFILGFGFGLMGFLFAFAMAFVLIVLFGVPAYLLIKRYGKPTLYLAIYWGDFLSVATLLIIFGDVILLQFDHYQSLLPGLGLIMLFAVAGGIGGLVFYVMQHGLHVSDFNLYGRRDR
ncbi:hypothetical protein [uncultured Parasphingopyxis sp.]|uniref:hypothetical protein n=1 Tax=uncultured Parasphingopyxis sp. TaxID=1547918 RepID=UPI002622E15B|nr:hypothetical protein [uncultured Parasphingopyxis sp.]